MILVKHRLSLNSPAFFFLGGRFLLRPFCQPYSFSAKKNLTAFKPNELTIWHNWPTVHARYIQLYQLHRFAESNHPKWCIQMNQNSPRIFHPSHPNLGFQAIIPTTLQITQQVLSLPQSGAIQKVNHFARQLFFSSPKYIHIYIIYDINERRYKYGNNCIPNWSIVQVLVVESYCPVLHLWFGSLGQKKW